MAPEFRVLDAQYVPVSPPPGVDVEEGACSFPLTFFDVKWLHLPPVERVLLYRLLPHHHHHHQQQDEDQERDDHVSSILSGLKESLKQQCRAFFPLAGHVRLVPGRSDRHEILYEPGDAVHFTTAEYDVDLDDLASDDPPVQVSAISPLVPPLPKGRAVLAVQATLLRRSGIAVGVTIHHSACDGRGTAHFLQTWAAACAGMDLPPPVIDRTLIPDPRGLYDTYLKGMPPIFTTSEDCFELVPSKSGGDDAAIATFTLSSEELQGIRSAVAREAARRGHGLSPRCSPLVAAYGLMWWCHCNSTSHSRDRLRSTYYFLFSVDQRARMKPAIPDTYLGNCMCPAIATATRDEMIGKDSGLYVACAAVAAAIEQELAGDQGERWDGCVDRVKNAVANGTLSVAGSPRFRVYDIDFGFGRPAKVHIVSAAKAGAISVADSRAGGRGLELGVSLPPDAMDRFRACFAHAMDSLRE